MQWSWLTRIILTSNLACKTSREWTRDESKERNQLQANKPCVIPFWFNGKDYNGCTNVNSDDIGNNYWCATVATSENDKEDFDIEYGVCPLTCKRHNGTNWFNIDLILRQIYVSAKIELFINDLILQKLLGELKILRNGCLKILKFLSQTSSRWSWWRKCTYEQLVLWNNK